MGVNYKNTGPEGIQGPPGPASTVPGPTGPTGPQSTYIFDGGSCQTSYRVGPAFDCGSSI